MMHKIRSENTNNWKRKNTLKNKWKEYIGELFHDERRKRTIRKCGNKIFKSEVRSASEKRNRNKTAGLVGIEIELILLLVYFDFDTITEIINEICDNRLILVHLCICISVVLPKEPSASKCNRHWTVILRRQITKILVRIQMNKVCSRIDRVL